MGCLQNNYPQIPYLRVVRGIWYDNFRKSTVKYFKISADFQNYAEFPLVSAAEQWRRDDFWTAGAEHVFKSVLMITENYRHLTVWKLFSDIFFSCFSVDNRNKYNKNGTHFVRYCSNLFVSVCRRMLFECFTIEFCYNIQHKKLRGGYDWPLNSGGLARIIPAPLYISWHNKYIGVIKYVGIGR